MSLIIASPDKSLNRDIDVFTSVEKAQSETTTDLSVMVFSTTDAPFDHGAARVRYYNSESELSADFAATKEAYKAGLAAFSQSPRMKTFAVGKIFTTPQAGYLRSKAYNSSLSAWVAVTDGSLEITVDGVANDVTGLDFSSDTTFAAIAATLQAGISAVVAGVTVVEANGTFKFTSGTTGVSSAIAPLATVDPLVGTDVSGIGFINAQDDPTDPADNPVVVPGYTPSGNIVDEMNYIAEAASVSKKFIYAWTLDREFRDSSDQVDVAAWAGARKAIFGACLNSPLVLDPNSTSDIGYLISQQQQKRAFTVYHDNAYYYPEVAILARMLSVNYAAENSTMTAKFKDLIGIPTVGVDSTDVTILNAKRVNTFTAVGNDARTFREGTETNDNWFIDDLINLDNYEEELQAEVYNVFLQNKKVPYNATGVQLIRSAIERISNRYVFNGTFSEREVLDPAVDFNKPRIEPAYTISSAPLGLQSASDRANRIGPPFTVDANLGSAIHSTSIQINAFS